MKYFLLLIMFANAYSAAQVYTWTNKDGVKVYGDEPPTHAIAADLPELQTMSIKKASKPIDATKEVKDEEEKNVGYSLLNIATPQEDEMILAGKAGKTTVQIQIQPPLQANHEITLLMDGVIVGKGPQLLFELDNIFRGSHLLQAKIKHQGKLLISSPKRRIHVQRPSILNR